VNIYTAPRAVAVGDTLTADEVITRLRHAGYSAARGNTLGWYHVRPQAVEIFPGRDSYAEGEAAVIEFRGGKVARIVSLGDHTERKVVDLEPQLMANLSSQRERRRLVKFGDIPPSLVHAVISAEDKHFFRHSGFDLFRMIKAAYVDLKDGRKEQGASTLSMQLARGFWLDSNKNWRRKLEELFITSQLERRLSKQQIFEHYANQVYLGRHGTFSVNGFGEAARVYFAKDLGQLSVPEAALLAGLIQRPSYYNPYRYPDRAKERRDLVLGLMRQNGYLTEEQRRLAVETPVKVQAEQSGFNNSQYFVDLMNEEMQNKIDEHGKPTSYVYTTLDPDLQEAAQHAVASGMQLVDKELGCRANAGKRARAAKAARCEGAAPQVALIALDPHTGEIKALVGGRNYLASQLDHALAMRQPGSVFKPFVYAAALETAVAGGSTILTAATVVPDEPTTFFFNHQVYQPNDYHEGYEGSVTLRAALAHSLNVPAVEVAEKVGYEKVVQMAHRMGLNEAIKATPSVALGSYETTPLEIAGAYTVFANNGAHVTPTTISLVRSLDGSVLYRHEPDRRNTLDPRVNYLVVNMLQDVLRYGTGASVHARGFNLPAAGKTGTSRDGWFAGFTSNLLCVVWVGFDDNRELNLEGAHSALPIWADFMKQAARFRRYEDARNFQAPPGVMSARICEDSGQLEGAYCTNVRTEVFINGSEPSVECELHASHPTQYADRVVEDTPPGGPAPLSPAMGVRTAEPLPNNGGRK
jgi:penicillin-binding protein 1B